MNIKAERNFVDKSQEARDDIVDERDREKCKNSSIDDRFAKVHQKSKQKDLEFRNSKFNNFEEEFEGFWKNEIGELVEIRSNEEFVEVFYQKAGFLKDLIQKRLEEADDDIEINLWRNIHDKFANELLETFVNRYNQISEMARQCELTDECSIDSQEALRFLKQVLLGYSWEFDVQSRLVGGDAGSRLLNFILSEFAKHDYLRETDDKEEMIKKIMSEYLYGDKFREGDIKHTVVEVLSSVSDESVPILSNQIKQTEEKEIIKRVVKLLLLFEVGNSSSKQTTDEQINEVFDFIVEKIGKGNDLIEFLDIRRSIYGTELRDLKGLYEKMKNIYVGHYAKYPKLQELLLQSFDEKINDPDTMFEVFFFDDAKNEMQLLSFFSFKHNKDANEIYIGAFNTNDIYGGGQLGVAFLENFLENREKKFGVQKIEALSIPQEGINSIYMNRYNFVADDVIENYENSEVDLFHMKREKSGKEYFYQKELDRETLKKDIINSTEQIEDKDHFIIKVTQENITQISKQLFEKGFVLTKYDIDDEEKNIYCGFEKV